MELLNRHGLYQRTIMRNKGLVSVAMVATSVGALCSYNFSRNHFFFARNGGSDVKNWFSEVVGKRSKRIKTCLPETTVNSLLQHNEHTNKIGSTRHGIISSFETNHYGANKPLEDRHCECYLNFEDSYLFGVFDGHSGWQCSESLRTRLPLYISLGLMNKDLRNTFISKKLRACDILEYLGRQSEDEVELEHIPSLEEKQKQFRTGKDFFVEEINKIDKIGCDHVKETLMYSYLALDKDITVEAIPDGTCNEPIWSGLSGAVAVTAYIKNNDLYVSNTGDCRAVLGKKVDGNWYNEPLSHDHHCGNIYEVERIKSEHPKEKRVIFQERLLGQLQPLRSFGDVPYKWNRDLHRNVLDVIYGHPTVPRNIYLTPPYLTAEPEVQYTRINKNVSFLILATDGLWDFVSNSEAVKIIGSYLDDLKNNVEHSENGATKLIRHALGQGDTHRLSSMLVLPENIKRNYHDDITVTVIYFDDDRKSLTSKL